MISSRRPCIWLLLTGWLLTTSLPQASAQTTRRPTGGQTKSAAAGSAQRSTRPRGNLLHSEEKISPRLEQILQQWEMSSKRIERLEGKHLRRVYDGVFKVEKRADGSFYYESPDKGRIDIEPFPIKPGQKSSRKDPETGKPYDLESDQQAKWICDGKQVMDVDEKRREVTIYPIPPQKQGVNIMDGPLPFLFGMPAEDAKQRFRMTLVKDGKDSRGREVIHLKVLPRRQGDRVNWSEAQVILDRRSFLPLDVQLTDSAGSTITVYSFREIRVNKKRIFWIKLNNPFNPPLRGYQTLTRTPGSPDEESGPLVMPDFKGHRWQDAQTHLKKMGVNVSFKRGTQTRDPKYINRIESQSPPARTRLKPGATVTLNVWTKPKTVGEEGSRNRSTR